MFQKIIRNVLVKIEEKIKEPDGIYSAIFPLYLVCKVFALAPYKSVRIENANAKRQYQDALIPKVCSIFKMVIIAVLIVLNIYLEKVPFLKSDISVKLEYFQRVCSGLLSVLEVILAVLFAEKIVQVFRNVDEIDVTFHSLAVWVPYKPTFIHVCAHLMIIFALFTGIIVLIFTKKESEESSFTSALSTVLPSISYLMNLMMELQYFNYLNILRIRYQLLNEYLEALVYENKRQNVWTADRVTKSKKYSKNISKSIASISDPIFIIDNITILHIKLSDTAILINAAFCVQLLVRITIAFVSIVTALFLIALNFSKSAGDDRRMKLNGLFTAWAFSSALEILAVVWITSSTCDEANKSPRLFHKIRNNTTNAKLQDVIEIYSLQMYHNRLHFTVCGLFPLDYTLLYTIVAGVTTYLVILIQFNNNEYLKVNSTD